MKVGYVALVGRPNAGKSTLLNRLLGGKLAITSAKPQTTRNRIAGILTNEEMQAIFVDTPGIHIAWTELNKRIVSYARSAINDVDAVCWVGDMSVLARRVEAGEPVLDEVEEEVARLLEEAGRPVIFVANKIDVVPHPLLLPVIDAVQKRLGVDICVPTSALTGDGMEPLLAEVKAALPEGPQLFPEDEWTQVTERFLVSEVVREKIIHLTEQEIPYSTAVEVVTFDESERDAKGKKGGLVRILCNVVVERQSQKGIVIGKRGDMLKRIGTMARKELEEVLGCRVYLELFVKVEKNWTRSAKGLRKLGFED